MSAVRPPASNGRAAAACRLPLTASASNRGGADLKRDATALSIWEVNVQLAVWSAGAYVLLCVGTGHMGNAQVGTAHSASSRLWVGQWLFDGWYGAWIERRHNAAAPQFILDLCWCMPAEAVRAAEHSLEGRRSPWRWRRSRPWAAYWWPSACATRIACSRICLPRRVSASSVARIQPEAPPSSNRRLLPYTVAWLLLA